MKISEKAMARLSAGLLVLLTVAVFVSIGSVIYREALRFPEQEHAFREEAEAYLGSSDFTVVIADGILYAVLEDGRRYPTDEVMAPYWTRRWMILGLFAVVLVVVSAITFYGKSAPKPKEAVR